MINYKCQTCGTAINEGEFKTFGVCDNCYDSNYKKQTAMTIEEEKNDPRGWSENEEPIKNNKSTGIQSDAPNEGREEKLQWPSKSELPNHSEKLEDEIKSLRDQLSKERENVDILKKAMIQGCDMYSKVRTDNDPVTPCQQLSQQLEKELEMRKELMRFLTLIPIDPVYWVEYQTVIAKASELDKNIKDA